MPTDPTIKATLQALELAGEVGKVNIQGFIKSRTLREALDYVIEAAAGPNQFELRFFLPHYWAVYAHDGRGPVRAAPGHFLVYFRHLADDPRYPPHPVNRTDIKRLSKQEFLTGVRMNNLMYKQNPEGGKMQHMIITEKVGPQLDYLPFMELGLEGFENDLSRFLRQELTKVIVTEILVDEKLEAVVRI